jgi:hypothetical protein
MGHIISITQDSLKFLILTNLELLMQEKIIIFKIYLKK